MKRISIKTESINLDQFLKWSGVTMTGGEAKMLIQNGKVKVNRNVETHRSKKLFPGDIVEIDGETFYVTGGKQD